MQLFILILGTFCSFFISITYADEKVYSLAQGCYAIRNPTTGKYLKAKYVKYKFEANRPESASKFYLKPSGLGTFILRDNEGTYLSTRPPRIVTRNKRPDSWAEWRITSTADNKFRFYSTRYKKWLKYNRRHHKLYMFDLFNVKQRNTDHSFQLVKVTGCPDYPEISLNLTKFKYSTRKARISKPVIGFVDSHAHVMGNEFMGGKFLHGQPYNPFGAENALGGCGHNHGIQGSWDLIGNLIEKGKISAPHKTKGYPGFPSWPNHSTLSHQQAYYKWIKRAHYGGLKLMVANTVQNEVLCIAQRIINPHAWINPNECDDMKSSDLQIKKIYEMQEYVDAQAGGPGKGFFRIVKSPEEARYVIANGQMAVVLGLEVSGLFGCREKGHCTKTSVSKELDKYYKLGVRSFFPMHKFNNAFGGTNLDLAEDLVNLGNYLINGSYLAVEECPVNEPSNRKLNDKNFLFQIAGNRPWYDQSLKYHCNPKYLTNLGEFLIEKMMKKKMIIEIDHMSVGAQKKVMGMLEAKRYSGIISSHSVPRLWPTGPYSHARLSPIQKRILHNGGLIFPYNGPSSSNIQNIKTIAAEMSKTKYLVGVGFGTDTNGLAPQAGVSSTAGNNPVKYPFMSYDGQYKFYKQKSGNREFDINSEGLAHYGLLPDLVQDIRINSDPTVSKALFSSAEAYLQMWERTTGVRK